MPDSLAATTESWAREAISRSVALNVPPLPMPTDVGVNDLVLVQGMDATRQTLRYASARHLWRWLCAEALAEAA